MKGIRSDIVLVIEIGSKERTRNKPENREASLVLEPQTPNMLHCKPVIFLSVEVRSSYESGRDKEEKYENRVLSSSLRSPFFSLSLHSLSRISFTSAKPPGKFARVIPPVMYL